MSGTKLEDKIDAMFGTKSEDDTNDQDTQQTTEGEAEEVTQSDDEGEKSAQPSNDRSAGERSTQQPSKEHKQGGQNAQGEQQPRGRLPANNAGDLVDPVSGAVIAKAGNERRFFEAARTYRSQVEAMNADLTRAQAEVAAYREAATLPRELGLSNAEVSNALQFFRHWKDNPAEAIKTILTEFRAMGYATEELGSTVDMAAIRRMVEETVSPFKQDREAATREAETAANVDRELNALYTTMPWARNQQAEIIALLESDTTLTLREAALHVQTFALQRGLDLNTSVRNQMLSAQNGKQPQRPNNARMSAPPMTGDVPIVPRRAAPENHSASSRDIVKSVMREAGFNVDNL
jgi:hypothetical protein